MLWRRHLRAHLSLPQTQNGWPRPRISRYSLRWAIFAGWSGAPWSDCSGRGLRWKPRSLSFDTNSTWCGANPRSDWRSAIWTAWCLRGSIVWLLEYWTHWKFLSRGRWSAGTAPGSEVSLGARLGERPDVGGRVPDASRRELHRQRRGAREEFRVHLRRSCASPNGVSLSGKFNVDELKLQAETASEPAPCPV